MISLTYFDVFLVVATSLAWGWLACDAYWRSRQ